MIYKILTEIFKYNKLKKEQEEIIKMIINGYDTFSVLPTGIGKSLIYQISGIYLKGVTVVVTPLISLMKDQVENLLKVNISAAYITDEMNNIEKNSILNNIDKYNFLYISCERLVTNNFYEKIEEYVKLIVFDEVHTLLWGLDFRTKMQDVNSFIRNLKKRPIVACFTATATSADIIYLKELLNIGKCYTKVLIPYRENIVYNVLYLKNRIYAIKKIIEKYKNNKIICYTVSRKECEYLDSIFNKFCKSSYYHALLSKEEKEKRYKIFKEGKINILFATNAFGMGIDIKDIRVVIAYDIPCTISDLLQQLGRAGRDGVKSYGFILYNKDSLKTSEYFISQSIYKSKKIKEFDVVKEFCLTKNKNKYLKKIYK